MKIRRGLFSNMVLQRRAGGSDAVFSGECRGTGNVTARARHKGRAMPGLNGIKVGKAARGKFTGRLRGIPTGGPYDVEISIENEEGAIVESCSARNVLVGDVWILAGQSNMEGLGRLDQAAKPHPMVRAFFMNDKWKTARDPIHYLPEAVDQVHSDLGGGKPPARAKHVGTGPGVAFGLEMFARTGVPQGLIACAHGGTSMAQWSPDLKSKGTASLYGAMLRRFQKNGGRIAGIVWHQGCSETSIEGAGLYRERMKGLVKAMCGDMGNVPIVAGQIARVASGSFDHPAWNLVQDAQRLLPKIIKNCAVVPAIDLDLDDLIHISGRGQNRLGARMAQAMCVLKGVRGSGKPPIELDSIVLAPGRIFVKFRNVIGRLKAAGEPTGFTLATSEKPVSFIHRTDVKGDMVVLSTNLPHEDLRKLFLHFGYGTFPYCNIIDEADRSLPVFGPLPLEKAAAKKK